jgi:ABC-type glycerol-3-phosphate transport system substrate-binding protein
MTQKNENESDGSNKPMMSRRSFLKMASLSVAGTALAACTPATTQAPTVSTQASTAATQAPEATPATIEWWVAEWNDEVRKWIQDEFKPKFEAGNPGITINPTFIDWGDYLTKLTTAFAGGTAPDLTAGGSSMVSTVATKKQGTVINDLVKEWGQLDDFYPMTQNVIQYKGNIYGLPTDIGVEALMWRKDLFEEAGLDPEKGPTNWDELIDYATKLTKRDGDAFKTAGFYLPSAGYSTWHRWVAFLWQAGGDILNEDSTKVIVNEQPGVDALQFYVDLLNKYKVSPISAIEQTGPPIFTTGQVAMMIGDQGSLAEVKQYAPDLYDKVGVLSPPLKKVRAAGAVFPDWVVVTSQTKNLQAAFKVLTAFADVDNNLKFNELYMTLPTRKSAAQKAKYISDDLLMVAMSKNVEFGMPWPQVPAFAKIREELTPMIQSAVNGEKTVKQALDDFAATIQHELDAGQ